MVYGKLEWFLGHNTSFFYIFLGTHWDFATFQFVDTESCQQIDGVKLAAIDSHAARFTPSYPSVPFAVEP